MKTHLHFCILVLITFNLTLYSQERINPNINLSKILGNPPIITKVDIVNDTCKFPTIGLTVLADTIYKFLWSNGQYNAMCYPKHAGNYFVTVTDLKGLSTTGGPYEIKDFPLPPSWDYQLVHGSCKNLHNGSILLKGYPNNSYSWSHDDTLHSFKAANLDAGSYWVTISEPSGLCKNIVVPFFVYDNTPKIHQIEIKGMSPCVQYPQTSGSIHFDVSLDHYPQFNEYSFHIQTATTNGIASVWDFYAFDVNIKGIPFSGYAKYFIYGNENCYVDTLLYIPILDEVTSEVFTSFPDKETHIYNGFVKGKGGQIPYTYLWSDGNTQKSRNDLVAGKTYHVTVTDIYGCTSISNVFNKKFKADNEVNFVKKGDNIEVRTGPTTEVPISKISFRLFDVSGMTYAIDEVYKNEKEWQMDISNLLEGMYYLSVQYEGDKFQTFPFVVVR